MKTDKLNPNVQKSKTSDFISKINYGPSISLFKKTFIFDVCPLRKLIIAIFSMVIVPTLIFAFTPTQFLTGDVSMIYASGMGFVTWYYNFSLIFPIIIITSSAPLISEEIRSRTMLYLVSKPISRTRIVLTKFTALLLYGIIVSFSSLSIICIIAIIKYPFSDIPAYLGMNFLYSLVILFFFGGMSVGLSSIFKKPRSVSLIPVMLVIFSFLVLMSFRPLLIGGYGYGPNLYERYALYHYDIGYHFANVFMWISEVFVPQIWNYVGMLFAIFGIVIWEWTGETYEIQITYYYHPIASLIYLIVIAGIILVAGIIFLNKRDISG
ncbi:MAG: ABC transporter permease subunit [Promethearchaeota archaeon]|nr:MAG: ABC transporter permease subunit [Candidatus Lokiarchaeota archaeon]